MHIYRNIISTYTLYYGNRSKRKRLFNVRVRMENTNANITVHCFSRYLILCICGHRVIVLLLALFRIL